MSYILNALRKSEQERLAQHADPATGRILAEQPQPPTRTGKWMLLLITVNLLVLACLFWFIRERPLTVSSAHDSKLSTPEKLAAKHAIALPAEIAVSAKPAMNNTKPSLPSIAELAAAEKIPAKPIAPVMAGGQKMPVPFSRRKLQPLAAAPTDSNALQVVQEAPVGKLENKPEMAAGGKTVPFLYELPSEFRHSVPDLKINVFVYSKQAAERFVMIDMVKYTVGQRIKDLLELKEIRPDSLVVEYNNRAFQIQRP